MIIHDMEILHCDCMDYMRGCADNVFDLAIVDPPYGIGAFSSPTSGAKRKYCVSPRINKLWNYDWNDGIPIKEYFELLKRVSTKQIIFGANYYNCFDNGGAIIWNKHNTHPNMSHCEIASVSWTATVKYLDMPWLGFIKKIEKSEVIHPCQKPIKLYRWILENYSEPSHRILDTHLGSGSIAIAAHYFGACFVGCEIDAEYYNSATMRIIEETKQLSMF